MVVLSDVKQREIYDKYGIEGIETAWQLGPHLNQAEIVSFCFVCFNSYSLVGGGVEKEK